MVLGTKEVGGISNVFEIANEGGRITWFNVDPNPFLRSSFWMVSVGLTSMWISNIGITPECVQRFVAIPSLEDATKTCWIFGIGHIFIKLFSVYNGLLIFAKYSVEKCDPVYNGDVSKYDQIFPYYVMDVGRKIPGLSGLFIVGALSAALSSMSSCLNSLAGTAYEDFIRPNFPHMSEKQASTTMKVLTFTIGCICFVLVFIVEHLGGVFSIGIAFSGITSGTLLGLFTMGMTSRRFNTTGALYGSIVSIVVVGFIMIGAQINIFQGNLRYETLPFNIERCDAFNS
jgi:Na+/proline symporter